jgi:hypothetical protein
MRKSTAAVGSAAYFAGAAGTCAVLVLWLVTGWEFHRPWPYWAQAAGVVLIACTPGRPATAAFRAEGLATDTAADALNQWMWQRNGSFR